MLQVRKVNILMLLLVYRNKTLLPIQKIHFMHLQVATIWRKPLCL